MSKITDVARSSGQSIARHAGTRIAARADASFPRRYAKAGPSNRSRPNGPALDADERRGHAPVPHATQTWEQSTGALLRRLLRPGARFLDVGANVGYFSLFVHRLACDIQIDAVEPHPVLHGLLQSNSGRTTSTARVHNAALGEHRRLLPMSSPPMNPGDSRVGVHTPDDRYDLVVPVIPADELFARANLRCREDRCPGFRTRSRPRHGTNRARLAGHRLVDGILADGARRTGTGPARGPGSLSPAQVSHRGER